MAQVEKKPSSYIHTSAFVEDGVELREGAKVWHFCHVRKGAVLEENVSIGKDVYVDANVRIGKNTRVQNGVSLYTGLKIAPWCFIGPHVIFTNDQTPRVGTKSWKVVETHLETGMSIGAGAIIRCGVKIGAFAMIGAGAIVTKDVPPFHLAMGFPAQCHQMVCACGQTFLPIATKDSELIRDCCHQNLMPELLAEVTALLEQRKLGT